MVAALVSLLVALGGWSPMPLAAQSAAADSNASRQWLLATAPEILVSDVARDLRVLTTDSLRVRATPSAALTAAAAYVAAEFQRLGLTAEVQEYAIPGQQRVDITTSKLNFAIRLMRNGKRVVHEDGWSPSIIASLLFQRDVYFSPDVGRQAIKMKVYSFSDLEAGTLGEPLTLLAGHYTAAAVRELADTLRGKTVLYVPPADADTAAQRQVVTALYAVTQGIIVAGPSDSGRFATALARAPEVALYDEYMIQSRRNDQSPWAVVVSGTRLGEILTTMGEDLAQLRASDAAVMRALSPLGLRVFSEMIGKAAAGDVARASNVVGTLQGSDPALRDECLFVVAPLDTRRNDNLAKAPADRVDDGADDGASALAGLLALARTFTQPGLRPRRSIVFLAASGGADGEFWGAKYFVKQRDPGNSVALAIDRLSSWPGDSALADGLRDIEVTPSLTWVAGTHPELDLRIVDGGTAAQPLADHFAFVRRTIPSLYVHAAGNSRTAVAVQVARGIRLVFSLAQVLADADRRPQWSSEGRRRLRMVLEP